MATWHSPPLCIIAKLSRSLLREKTFEERLRPARAVSLLTMMALRIKGSSNTCNIVGSHGFVALQVINKDNKKKIVARPEFTARQMRLLPCVSRAMSHLQDEGRRKQDQLRRRASQQRAKILQRQVMPKHVFLVPWAEATLVLD